MFKIRLVYRLIPLFFVFALLIVIPFSYVILKQVKKVIDEETVSELMTLLRDQIAPYIFYVPLLAFLLSLFFSRKVIASVKELQKGVGSLKEGDLDIKLRVIADDELGEAIKAFNEMAAALNKTRQELLRKDTYINAMLDPLWVLDRSSSIVDVNPAFTRFFGYSKEEIVGSPVFNFIDSNFAGAFLKPEEKKQENGTSSIYEMNVVAKDGSSVPVLVSKSPIYSRGAIVGEIGILKDFREQARLRTELQQSRDFLENIMDSIEEDILVLDKEYRIVKANENALKKSGLPVVGEPCYKIAHGSERPCWTEGTECPAQMVFLTGKNYRTVHRHVTEPGKRRFHEVIASPIRDSSGNVVNVIELIRDITDRVTREEELNRKNRELVALNSISGLLSRSLRPDEIFSRVIDKIAQMMAMDGGMLYLFDESSKEFVCRYHQGISGDFVEKAGNIRLNEDVPGRVASTGRIIAMPDISSDRRIENPVIRKSGIQGYCSVPIKGKERIIGIFILFSFTPHFFTTEEESILNSVGEMTGMALENIRLYEKMRELYEFQRERRDEEHAQLLSLSAKLGAEIDLREIIGSVLDIVRTFFHADFSWLLSFDNSGNLMIKSSVESLQAPEELVYDAAVVSVEKYAVEQEKPSTISDLDSDTKFYLHPVIKTKKFKSAAAIPMFIGRKPVGVFSLYYHTSRLFRAEELHFLEIIGNFLAVSLERADFYARAIQEKELSNTILQSAADGIITIDTEGKILSVNKSFEKIIGFLPETTVGLPVCNIFRFREGNENFRLLFGESFGAALEGKTVKREAVLVNVHGRQVPVLISSAPIQNMDGQVTGVVNTLRDISREKEIDRMKTEIIRSVSHEFRTPLSAIVGMTEMILNRDIEEDRAVQYLGIIKREGVRLTRMVSELLNIARIESGRESLKLSSVDIPTLIRSTLESFGTWIDSKEAFVRLEESGPMTVTGDEEKLKQVFINILDNALTFSDNRCTIEIKAQRKNNFIEIAISDDGWGIPAEDIPHITEKFYRGRYGEITRGTGLGLSLCDEIMAMHGGRMEISSKEGEGTRIILEIPVGEA